MAFHTANPCSASEFVDSDVSFDISSGASGDIATYTVTSTFRHRTGSATTDRTGSVEIQCDAAGNWVNKVTATGRRPMLFCVTDASARIVQMGAVHSSERTLREDKSLQLSLFSWTVASSSCIQSAQCICCCQQCRSSLKTCVLSLIFLFFFFCFFFQQPIPVILSQSRVLGLSLVWSVLRLLLFHVLMMACMLTLTTMGWCHT